MNGYNFTERVRKVLQMAREQSVALNHEYVGTEHILLGLLAEGGGVASTVLANLGIDAARVRADVLIAVPPGKDNTSVAADLSAGGILGAIADTFGVGRTRMDLPYTSRAKRTLEMSMSEVRNLRHSYVGTEHLLIGLLVEQQGIAAQVLTAHGLTPSKLREEVLRVLGTEQPASPDTPPVVAPQKPPRDLAAAITLVVEHPDGRIEAKKFKRTGDAVSFLNELEY